MVAVALAVAVAFVLEWSGSIADVRAALLFMGFDPDRARLIAALSVAAMVVAVTAFATGLALVPGIAGVGLFGVLFAHSFVVETRVALSSTGYAGRFDAVGWLATLGTLLVSAIVVAWASATLATVARSATVRALADARSAIRSRRPRSVLLRPVALVATVVAILIAVPTFGDMVNYTPDVHMRVGGDQAVGLVNAGPVPAVGAPGASGAPEPVVLPPAGTTLGAPSAVSSERPWMAWRPTGNGTVTQLAFPAPWTDGRATLAGVWIYTPPGYATSGRAYPVIYVVPWGQGGWAQIGIFNDLDGLADAGTIPGTIVVFVSEIGGPYTDSECIDSPDQREHMESYLTQTIVPYVDTNYRTIPSPAGRALLGQSQGGFCVAMLALRHPDLFGASIAFSGYYEAAIHSSQTINAALPFDGSQAAIAAHSPLTLLASVPPKVRHRMLFELSADPTNWFYGVQYRRFSAALEAAGYPVALFPTPLGHSWAASRLQLPEALTTLAGHEAAIGTFGT